MYFFTASHVALEHDSSTDIIMFCGPQGFKKGVEIAPKFLKKKSDFGITCIKLADYVDCGGTQEVLWDTPGVTSSSDFPASEIPHALTMEDINASDVPPETSLIYIAGFPSTSLGFQSDDSHRQQLEYNKPLVRQGIVAGIHFDKIILDCPVYYLNSGAPVIGLFGEAFRVCGIVDEFVPFIETLLSKQYKGALMSTRLENSGLSVANPISGQFLSLTKFEVQLDQYR